MSGRRSGFVVLAVYALVAAATQLLWLTYAAITDDAARYLHVSVSAVGWLAEIFPLLYVLLAIPAGILLDRHFRAVLGAGALLVAAGGLVRLVGARFGWALGGQALVAVGQPIVLSAVGKLAGQYLDPADRPAGIAIGSAGCFGGMLLALLLGPTVGAHGHLASLLWIEAVLGGLPALALLLVLRRRAPHGDTEAIAGRGAARALWRIPELRTLSALVFLGFGIFVALATWLQTLLHPDHLSDTTAGILLVGMVIAGVVGCAVLPPLVARRGAERPFMTAVVIASASGCTLLGAIGWLPARAAVLAGLGVLLLPALPVVLTAAEALAGSLAGTAGAIVWMAGNLGGLVVALVVQALVHHQLAAFLAMATAGALGWPFARRLGREPVRALPSPAWASPPGG